MVVIVTGVPRCGSSMTMRMLEFGGIPVAIDEQIHKRPQYKQINKYGFYELYKVNPDLRVYDGMAVKIFNYELIRKAPVFVYKIIMPYRKPTDENNAHYSHDWVYEQIRKIPQERGDVLLLEINYDRYYDDTKNVCQEIQNFVGSDVFDVYNAKNAVDNEIRGLA